MDKHLDWQKILRYLSGESNYSENLEITRWMDSNPENEEFIQFLELIWQMEPAKRRNIDADAAWERFQKKHSLEEGKDLNENLRPESLSFKILNIPKRYKRKSSDWVRYLALAASFLLAILLSLQFVDNTAGEEDQHVSGEMEFRELRTEKGIRTRIILTDGSVIHLNGDSYLRIPRRFMPGEDREVHLEGEAYFEIANNEDVRLRVFAGETVTTVLGTRFNVRSYEEEEDVTVVVTSGKVSFGSMNNSEVEPAILTDNYKGVIVNGGHPDVSFVEDLRIYYGWTEGELIFEGERLPQMITKLERWFGIDIEVGALDENLLEQRLTASFSERQPVEDVLQSISLVLDLSYERVDSNTAVNTFKFYH